MMDHSHKLSNKLISPERGQLFTSLNGYNIKISSFVNDCVFTYGDFVKSDLSYAPLNNCEFSFAIFNEGIFKFTNFSDSLLTKAEFIGADLSDVIVDRAVAPFANCKKAFLIRTRFEDAVLSGASFENSTLSLGVFSLPRNWMPILAMLVFQGLYLVGQT